jgi:dTDP-4-dehydrorhamnose reductase
MNVRLDALVIGGGHLGSHLARRWELPPERHWTREMEGLTPEILRMLAPRLVVNCAGKTDLPWCESHPGECFRCNVSAPLNVFRVVAEAFGRTVPCVHLSSGCVWDGPYHASGRPFLPDDPPTPACFYAWTKASCDALLLRERAGRVAILRPRQVFSESPSPRNTLSKLNGYPRLLDTPNSMTSAATVARTIEALAGGGDDCWNRILNVYDRGATSPFRVGRMLAQAGLREPPMRLNKSDLDAWHKPRRVDAVIEDPFFEALVRPPTIEEALEDDIAVLALARSGRMPAVHPRRIAHAGPSHDFAHAGSRLAGAK